MIKPELYERTVSILKDAYFNDTLKHSDCQACAVGNLCGGFIYWKWVFVTVTNNDGSKEQIINKGRYSGDVKRAIDATGYTWQELAKIEYAFETAPKGNSDDEWMFNGLMSVIEVLDQIHHNTDTAVTEVSKQKFVKA